MTKFENRNGEFVTISDVLGEIGDVSVAGTTFDGLAGIIVASDPKNGTYFVEVNVTIVVPVMARELEDVS